MQLRLLATLALSLFAALAALAPAASARTVVGSLRSVACLAVGALLLAPAAASAAPGLSVSVGFNARVNAISAPDANGTRYLGGAFTSFNAWDTGGGAAVGATSGTVDAAFPKVDGIVNAAASDGSGGFYIGGTFDCIGPDPGGSCTGPDDVARTNAAHLLADGSVDAAWNPAPDGSFAPGVFAIAVSGSTVYLGGRFTTVGGRSIIDVAAVDAVSGAVNAAWAPQPSGIRDPLVLAIAVVGSRVYVAGRFATIGARAIANAAVVDAASGAVDPAWAPQPIADTGGTVNAIAVAGPTVYLGGAFSRVDGQSSPNAAAVNATTGLLDTAWAPAPNSRVSALAVDGSTVYLGGEFDNAGGAARDKLAAVDRSTGAATPWAPRLATGYITVFALAVSGSDVYVGGQFADSTHANVTAISTAGVVQDWNPNVNQEVRALAADGERVYLGGDFSLAGGTPVLHAAAVGADGILDPQWRPAVDGEVRAVQVVGSTIYLGGRFGSVDGAPRANAAAITAGGTLVDAWQPNPDGDVYAVAAAADTTILLGGSFSQVGGQSRNNVAAVAADGAVTGWNPNANGAVNAIVVADATAYLGGSFDTLDAFRTTRTAAAAVSVSSGCLTAYAAGDCITAWDPHPDCGDPACENTAAVMSIAAPGARVYLGGYFSSVNGNPGTARDAAAAVDPASGAVVGGWADPALRASGSSTEPANATAIALSGSTVYIGGTMREAAGTPRVGAAAYDDTGALLPWNPQLDNEVSALTVGDSLVYLGGDFTMAGSSVRNFSAAVDATTGAVAAEPWPRLRTATLTVGKAGTGAGTVTSSPAGIACGSTCAAVFDDGATVTLTAVPAAGSTFAGWSGGCVGTTSTCTVTVTQRQSVTATFTGGGSSAAAAASAPGSFGMRLPVPPRLPVTPTRGFTALEIPVTCRAASGALLTRCTATITADPADLRTPGGLSISARGTSKPVVLGTAVVTATQGTKAIRLRVRLNAAGRKALRARLQVRTTVTVASGTAAGASGSRSTTSVLHLPTHVVVPTDGIFASSRWTPDAQGEAFLAQLARLLPARVQAITCTGYTDDRGVPLDNVWLGRERARNVCAGLAAHGVHSTRTTIVTKGAADPRSPNDTAAGRARNRRVAVTLTY